MWWQRFWYSVVYLGKQVAIKGGVSGALWLMFWFLVEETNPISDELFTLFLATSFVGLVGAVTGVVLGGIMGALLGGLVMAANGIFLREHTDLPRYRQYLVAGGALAGFIMFSWMIPAFEGNRFMGGTGVLLAGAGVAVSLYTYLPDYLRRFLYMEYDYEHGTYL